LNSIFLSLGAIAFIVWSIANAIKKSTKKTNKENKLDKLKDIQNNQVLPEKKPENEGFKINFIILLFIRKNSHD